MKNIVHYKKKNANQWRFLFQSVGVVTLYKLICGDF